jgi:hypothetical protein
MADVYGQALSTFTNFVGERKATVIDGIYWQTSTADGSTEYSTIGPEQNETFTTYSFDKGTHHIRFLAYVSPDILLVHQSKVAGFLRVVDGKKNLDPFQRDVKDKLLKDTNMRVRSSASSVLRTFTSGSTSIGVSSGYFGY